MIKKLQNNFTTPEQSKRLLELGVTADSADCVLENLNTAENNFQSEYYTRWIIEKRHVKEDIFCERNECIFLPCWSVGRLIEIYNTCVDFDLDNGAAIVIFIQDKSPIVQMMEMFEDKVSIMDFSKLEK